MTLARDTCKWRRCLSNWTTETPSSRFRPLTTCETAWTGVEERVMPLIAACRELWLVTCPVQRLGAHLCRRSLWCSLIAGPPACHQGSLRRLAGNEPHLLAFLFLSCPGWGAPGQSPCAQPSSRRRVERM